MDLLRQSLDLGLHDFKRHLRFPFEVPSGVAALRVTLGFDPPGAGEVRSMVNFSLFGPAGFVGAGHRHGARHEVLVGPEWATPGFLPGPVPPGAWAVVVHTHMLADATRLDLTVEALEERPVAPAAEAALDALARSDTPWMTGDLHCHSTHSDARWTVRELAGAATAQGLAFLSLTDHNTASGRAELARLAPHLLQLPGLELTTFYGHATVLGLDGYLDWTGLSALSGTRELADEVREAGGLFTIAHPFETGDPVCTGCAWTYFDLRPEGASHLEVWNGPWHQPKNAQALAHWYGLLMAGRRVVATAGTDAHGPAYAPGCGFTCTPRTDSPSALLGQLRAGNTYLARAACLDLNIHTPAGPAPVGGCQPPGTWHLSLSWHDLPEGCRLDLIVDGERTGRSLAPAGELGADVSVARWLNLEVRLPDGDLYALTNPVWAAPGA